MNRKHIRILIVDDEPTQCEALSEVLSDEGYTTDVAYNGKEAFEKIKKNRFNVVFCDIRMPEMDGLRLLEKTMEISPRLFFIIMTAYGSMETTLKALKLGAHDYVVKPLNFEDVILKLKHLIAYQQLTVENRESSRTIVEEFALDNVLGQGQEMKIIYSLVQKVAPTPNTILITGEMGVGKEELAKAIHYQSQQREHKFVIVRCGSESESSLEHSLFGAKGMISHSKGGTLYLDEVSDLTLGLQKKLLDALSKLGGQEKSLRFILSTHKDLVREVHRGSFREDLLYQINVIEIKIPPLRARKSDIPFLVKYYVRTASDELGKRVRFVTDAAQEALMNYVWSGNIRELENILERGVLLSGPDTQYLDVNDLPGELTSIARDSMRYNFKETMRQYEYKHIQRVLEKNEFNKKKAAAELGLSLSSLYRKIEELSVPMQ